MLGQTAYTDRRHTELCAPFIGYALAHKRPGALAIAWNVFGFVDLIVAPTAALLSHANVFWIYPLSLVPLFLGPPLGILIYVYSLRNLMATRHANVATFGALAPR